MSFEKKMQKRGNDKLNQFAKNPYHQEPVTVTPTPKVKRFPVWATVLIPSVTVACAIILVVPMMMSMGAPNGAMKADDNKHEESPTAQEGSKYPGGNDGYSYNQGEGSQTYAVPTWEEATILQKYPEFTYQDNQYYIRYADSSEPIASTYIDTKLTDITVTPNTVYEAETRANVKAELYSIKNIALEASLAVKFLGSEDYYAYQNIACYFANLGELMDKISFRSEVKFLEAHYHHYDESDNYYNDAFNTIDEQAVMNILFKDLTIINQKTKQRLNLTSEGSDPNQSSGGYTPGSSLSKSCVTLLTEIKCLGINNASIQLYGNGTLHVNLFGSLATFELGESAYQELVSYLTNN